MSKPGSQSVVNSKPRRSSSLANHAPPSAGPPKLPPKTYKTLERQRKYSVEQVDRPQFRVIDEKEFTPEALVRDVALPQMVSVCQGYDGASSENSVSIGDEFIVHFVKSMQVIPAKLSGHTNDKIYIPVNSPLSIGIIRADNNRIYPSVMDLLKLHTLPKVVEVRRAFVSQQDNGFVVEKTSVLYITGRRSTTLLYCKHETGKKLTLTADLVGDFSTDPMEAVIPIAEYTILMQAYPVNVRLLQRGVDVDDATIAQYIGQAFDFEAPIEKRSLIATTDVNGTRIENPSIVELPMELPLLFKCIERVDDDMERAYSFAIELYSTFEPSQIDVTYGSVPVVGEGDYTQLYESPDEIQDNVYVSFDILCPNPRTDTFKRALQKNPSKSLLGQTSMPPEKPKPRKESCNMNDAENDHVTQLNAKIETLVAENSTLKKQLILTEKKCSDLESELVRVNKTASRLSTQLEKLTAAAGGQKSSVACSPQENKERLSKMSTGDISNLLSHLNYEMYKPKFSDELVDGQLLVSLEEGDLKELGIDRSVHRRRFMNLIQGVESVDKYLHK